MSITEETRSIFCYGNRIATSKSGLIKLLKQEVELSDCYVFEDFHLNVIREIKLEDNCEYIVIFTEDEIYPHIYVFDSPNDLFNNLEKILKIHESLPCYTKCVIYKRPCNSKNTEMLCIVDEEEIDPDWDAAYDGNVEYHNKNRIIFK